MDSVVCSRRILVSDLPQMDPESLLDKLGFHFSRKKNGGGEVETCQMMEDTWTAVITFTEDDSETALSQCCSGLLWRPAANLCPSAPQLSALWRSNSSTTFRCRGQPTESG